MDYPKMLYRSAEKFADQKALELGIHTRAVQTLVVRSAAEEAAADEWTADLSSLIKRGPGRPKGS